MFNIAFPELLINVLKLKLTNTGMSLSKTANIECEIHCAMS